MPSSTSSSERPGLVVRQTAADRPGVAQPVPERDVPARPWLLLCACAFALAAGLVGLWEAHWRAFGAPTGYYANDDSQWAAERRRINQGEGGGTVLIGSSRVLFDVQLDVWQQATGVRPIQLALEGTSSVLTLEDLAADPDFTGRLLVGVAPDLFFSGFGYRTSAITGFHKEGPSRRIGHWLSQRMVEPYFAFYDQDFALGEVVDRLPWPQRPGMKPARPVRKLSLMEADRNTHMWPKVVDDPDYRAMAQQIWAVRLHGPPPPMVDTPAKAAALAEKQIARAVAAVKTLRARGVRIVFVRPPSGGDYYEFEKRALARERTWDVLLQRTGMPGIHFEDYPQLQETDLPEWSHLSHAAARHYTAALAPLVTKAWEGR
jgi:hypothetical protein